MQFLLVKVIARIIEINELKNEFLITFKDQGPGFKENNIDNIFKRFYSNRPKNLENIQVLD